jgi:hypothetical protein
MEAMQQNMEVALSNIAANTARHRGANQGNEVNQYSSFKDFLDTKPLVFREATKPLKQMNGGTLLNRSFAFEDD